jgi:lysyl-tRNA synthetase class I
MKNLENKILRNGIKTLMEEDDSSFKKSLTRCLSLKLNTAIKETQKDFTKRLFEKNETAKINEDIEYFSNFVENYDPKNNNRLRLKNYSYININESELKMLTELFDSLSGKNKELMAAEILHSPNNIRKNIEFYKKAQIK